MRKQNSPAVQNVFKRALEAKKCLCNADGTMPQAVKDLCFPAPELAPEVIDDWNRKHDSEDELIDKFVLRNTFAGDFDSAGIILLDNCVPEEHPGKFTRDSLLDAVYFRIRLQEELDANSKVTVYGLPHMSFSEFWQHELHTPQNTGLLDAFYPVPAPVCSAEEDYRRFKLSGRNGILETSRKIEDLKKHFVRIAWFTLDLERFTRKTHYYNFGREDAFILQPYYNYFRNVRDRVIAKVRRALAEHKVIICRNELPLWHKEIDFSNCDNFFYLYNPSQPICRGNVGQGCDLSRRNSIDPFDLLVNACRMFLQ